MITVEVDYMDSISETDENNNKIIYEFTIYEYPLANLKYAEGDFSITIVPEVPAVGDTVSIYATFENVGGSDCSNFYVSFTEIYEDEEIFSQICVSFH